jgi:chemotaxis methyl-accepting protein methylase
LISRIETMLNPGGLLLIGHTESLFHTQHQLEQLGGGIFRRPK